MASSVAKQVFDVIKGMTSDEFENLVEIDYDGDPADPGDDVDVTEDGVNYTLSHICVLLSPHS